jgi:hypothetical protein
MSALARRLAVEMPTLFDDLPLPDLSGGVTTTIPGNAVDDEVSDPHPRPVTDPAQLLEGLAAAHRRRCRFREDQGADAPDRIPARGA